jgi:Cu(I)/Ag(I) efflux system membrane protein CusA/SilA
MWSEGTGAEVMQRIAAPMIGGMITAPLLSMFVVPAAYYLMRRRGLAGERPAAPLPHPQRVAP